MNKKYITTKKECERKITGVCEECGGNLEPIETVDNAKNPTFWVGCLKCSCFRQGINIKYFNVATEIMHEAGLPTILSKASLSRLIFRIDKLLGEYKAGTQKAPDLDGQKSCK